MGTPSTQRCAPRAGGCPRSPHPPAGPVRRPTSSSRSTSPSPAMGRARHNPLAGTTVNTRVSAPPSGARQIKAPAPRFPRRSSIAKCRTSSTRGDAESFTSTGQSCPVWRRGGRVPALRSRRLRGSTPVGAPSLPFGHGAPNLEALGLGALRRPARSSQGEPWRRHDLTTPGAGVDLAARTQYIFAACYTGL